MKLKDYLAIAGEHGLFKFVAQGRNAIIVEHLESGKRTSAHASAKVSSLEDISIFTENEDLSLSKVFDTIFDKENGGPAPDPKSNIEQLKKYFIEIVPDYDTSRVYASDIKKVILWYNILQKLNLLVKEEEGEVEEEGGSEGDKKDSKTENEIKPAASSKAKPKSRPKPANTPKGKTESKSAATISKGAPKIK
jgi:hypothetical protein